MIVMKGESTDQPILGHIQRLADEEHRLYEHPAPSSADRKRLAKINVELDRCWDLLRHRQALRDAGQNPNHAHVRSTTVIENYV